jgi:hypothetical protein
VLEEFRRYQREARENNRGLWGEIYKTIKINRELPERIYKRVFENRGSLRMKKTSIILITFLNLFLIPVNSNTGTLYKWRDENGKLHIVDDINQVPQEY